uniref:Uncharacterized protein n=1 Tax=Glossina morsitans morsitans TaxID=37546 RepID=A0A1B0FLU5_GLOMM
MSDAEVVLRTKSKNVKLAECPDALEKVGLASLPIAYGLNALKSSYEISKYMRTICNEVKNSSGSSKNVLVILNPVADKKNFEKMVIFPNNFLVAVRSIIPLLVV